MIKKSILALCLFSFILMALPTGLQATEKVLKIGFIAPLTGPGAAWGLTWQRTKSMQVDQYNAAGGIKIGQDTYKLELIYGDDKYSASEAVNIANKLIYKDGVKFIFGPIGSAPVLAVSKITEANKILTFPSSFTSKALGPDKPYTFRAFLSSGEINPVFWKLIKQDYPMVQKVAILGPNDESGWHNATEFDYYIKKMGYERVSVEYFERGTNDFYPLLTRVLPKKPDLIVLDASTGDLGLILKQVRQMGYQGLTFTIAPHDPTKLCKIAGEQGAEGHLQNGFPPLEGVFKEWDDRFYARWNYHDTNSVGFTLALEFLVEGLKKAGTTDPDKVKETLANFSDFKSYVYGPCKVGGKARYGINHQLIAPTGFVQIKKCANVGKMYPMEDGIAIPEGKIK